MKSCFAHGVRLSLALAAAITASPALGIALHPPGATPVRPEVVLNKTPKERHAEMSRGDEGDRDRWAQWFYGQRSYPYGHIPPGAMGKALQHAKTVNGGGKKSGRLSSLAAVPPFQPKWLPLGPAPIVGGQTDTSLNPSFVGGDVSGRVSAIAPHPSDGNTVYVGGAQGGVWKSVDGGASWTPKTDAEASLAVGFIAIDPVDPEILYVGTGESNGSCDSYYGAGVLRSTDGGDSWTLLGGQGSPNEPFFGQSISKIIIDPATAGSASGTTLWASTALAFISSGTEQCDFGPGLWNGALWRSTDSGATWDFQDVPTGAGYPNNRIHDMVLDPTDPNTLYVAVRNNGIWKSTNAKDSSASFTQLASFPSLAVSSPAFRRITLGIGGSGAPGTLYASLQNANDSSLWAFLKTSDAGATWNHVAALTGSGSLRGTKIRKTGGGGSVSTAMIGRRVLITVGGVTFSRTVTNVKGGKNVFFSGAKLPNANNIAFSIGAYPNYCDGQCFYNMTIGVDPSDPSGNTVYVGGNPNGYSQDQSGVPGGHTNWKSTDGGASWGAISQGNDPSGKGGVHTDDHAIAIGFDGTIYDGNDGGIWKSTDGGTSWINLNTNLQITQFQGLALHPTDAHQVLGGNQDNGTVILGNGLNTPPAWFHTDYGDGGQAIIDQSSPSTMFHTYYNQSFNFFGPGRTDNGGVDGPGSWPFVGAYYGYGPGCENGMDPTDPVSFYAPMAQHTGFTPNVIYFGTNKIYRSANPLPTLTFNGSNYICSGNSSWTAISPDLTASGVGSGWYLSAIGVLPNLVNGFEVLYSGSGDGCVASASDIDGTAVATWSPCIGGLPTRFVTEVEVDASDPTGNTAYATFSGFGTGHVFRITDGLSGSPVATDISGDLPDIPANAIALTPGNILVGTDIGVFRSTDGGTTWTDIDDGFPNVTVFGLERNPGTKTIVAATHGRGMFRVVPRGDANDDLLVDVNDMFYLINFVFANGPDPLGDGDANGDGVVDVNDVFYLINYLFANGPPPPL